jgi:hypothetical protein
MITRQRFLAVALTVAGCLLLTATNIRAQVLYGSLVGSVSDESGAVLPGATVRITNPGTGETRETTTNDAGTFSFPDLPSSKYEVAISKEGFKTSTTRGVVVSVDRVARFDTSLHIGQVSQTVEVTTQAPVLQTDSAQVRTELPTASLENLPVPVNRNYQNLLVVVPGFMPPANQHSAAVNPSRGLTASVNGATRNSNNLRIDGASSTNVWLPHVPGYVPGLEAIQEVSVVTNSSDAAEGLAAGAVVNVHIKSGTNQLHGSMFEYHTDNALKAKPYNFFNAVAPQKPKYVSNDFGGSIGGPMVRDKLFFFGSYDGNPLRQSASPASDLSVPSAALRQGDFSSSPNPIYDPATGNQTNGTLRTQFMASSNPTDPKYNPACKTVALCPNIIPVARFDAIALKIQALVPLPTGNPTTISNNFHAVGPYNFNRHTTDGKVDWHATSKLNLSDRIGWLRYNYVDAASFGSLVGPPVSSAGGKVGNAFGDVISNTVSGTYTIRPNLLVDGYFALTRLGINQEPPRLGENLGLNFLGIPGTNGPSREYGGWPEFTVGTGTANSSSNFSDFGNPGPGSGGGPVFYADRQYQYSGNATWTHRSHTVRFGGELMQQTYNHFETGSGPGQFVFNGNATTIPGGKGANMFNSYAQFLLGLPSQINHELLPFDHNRLIAYSHNYGFYGQDQWQALRSLTVTYGLRWDHFPVGNRNGRGMERYDFATNLVTICGLGGTPRDCGYRVSSKEFSPRVGLAWRATETFVVRAGFAINYDPFPLAFVRDMLNDYPLDLSLSIGPSNSFLAASKLAAGIPAITVPNISSGAVPLPKNFNMQTLPQNVRRDYVEGWNLTLQKELKWGFTGQAGYVGSRQVKIPQFLNLNVGQIGGGPASQPFNTRNGTASLNLITPLNHTHYDALQTQLSRRFAGGYQVNVSYTLSKATAICCDELADKTAFIQIPQYLDLNQALAPYDRTHVFAATGVAELPFGKGKPWLSDRSVASGVLGGWQLSSLFSAYSGTPFTVTASGSSLNAPGNNQMADKVKSHVAILGGVGPNPFFDPLAFAPVTQARFGNSGLNSVRGPGYIDMDFSLFRNFSLSERWKLQFRAEAFNFTNTPHFSNPGANVSNLQLDASGNVKNLNGYDQITSTTGTGRDGIDERQFRFGVRISF